MKIYCMACGRASEYIGPQNKPSSCICGNAFDQPLGSVESSKKKGLNVAGGKVVVGDMKLDRTFLLNLINIEFEE